MRDIFVSYSSKYKVLSILNKVKSLLLNYSRRWTLDPVVNKTMRHKAAGVSLYINWLRLGLTGCIYS